MSDILLDVQGAPAAPSAGQLVIYADSVTKRIHTRDDAGIINVNDSLPNRSVAAQGAGFASDTYLIGSSIAIPASVLRVGALYRLTFDVSKSAAGVATPVIIVRFGTLGTTGDAARLTFTFAAQTAVADLGMFDLYAMFRTVGAAAVLQGRASLRHGLSITGLGVQVSQVLQVTSGAFDSSVANSIIGVSVNGGASAAWTVQLVESELANI